MQNIITHFDLPDMTTKQYDQIRADIAAAGHEQPKGRIHHVAGISPAGMQVVDIWESMDAFSAFGETLMPILVKNGVTPAVPNIMPVHHLAG